MKRRPINMILYVALMLGLLVFFAFGTSRVHATDWQWDGVVNKYDFYPAHAFVTSGEVPDTVFNKLREIPGVDSASLVYQPKYDETWVTILKIDAFSWDAIDIAVSAIMGANRIE